MNIHRDQKQPLDSALFRPGFCLDQLEKAKGFKNNIKWSTEIVHHLTVEELVGALVSAEQEIKEYVKYNNEENV